MRRTVAFLAVLLMLPLMSATAQGRRGGGGSGGDRQGPPPTPQQRQEMEARLQAHIDSIVRVRLSLTDDQFKRLQDVATRMEKERRDLRMDDGRLRMEMRHALTASTVNEDKVAELLAKMPQLERRRLGIMEREQRELSQFLTPSQRARYISLQDELRRSMQEMQFRRMTPGGAYGPPGGSRPSDFHSR